MTTVKTHIQEFFRLKCAPDILAERVFPNAKEITESMGAFYAVWTYLADTFPLDDPYVNLYAVGDGCTPRTATLFAYRTAWQCYSIDPLLRPIRNNTFRLYCQPSSITDYKLSGYPDKAVIVCVHSHATMKDTLNIIQARSRAMVAIPCCVPYNSPIPCISYEDAGIWSEKRTVKIWKQI